MIEGRDIIAIPMAYYDEFRRDPMDSLLKYGSKPQRARMPWFTDTQGIEDVMNLPDQVVGPTAEAVDPEAGFKSLVAAADESSLIRGISPYFHSTDAGYWHVHVDLALNKKRHGDAAGIAMGRIVSFANEVSRDPNQDRYLRVVRTFEVPLVAQIVAPSGGQIYISSITRLILQLKQLRGFNITSFSFDGFQSAESMQQLALAGLVTAGMQIDDLTGEVHGLPQSFSVDRGPQPYREVLEAVNERRVALPRYALLRSELRKLEVVAPGHAPDHGSNGSKDVADPVAGILGYLSTFGHAELEPAHDLVMDREDLTHVYDVPPPSDFGVVDDDPLSWTLADEPVTFGVE